MSEKIKISVIVPVYNVAPFFNQCMRSLLHQIYQNYEILLIDDGSTDESGAMCDSYAKQFDFVKVFHKCNAGQSSARNYALPYITGQYVSFVDADDYVEKNYLADMAEEIIDRTVDMVVSTYWDEYPQGKSKRGCVYPKEIFTSEQALKEMCYERKISTSPCGKLIATNVVKAHSFPEGKKYEDLATIYKMIDSSRKIVFTGKPLYHYVQRAGSTTNSGWKKYTMDIMEASNSLLLFIVQKYPNIYSAAVYRYFFSAQEIYKKAYKEDDYLKKIQDVQMELKRLWPTIRHDCNVTNFQKMKMYLMTFHPYLYKTLRGVARR